MAERVVTINQAALKKFTGWNGPVGLALARLARDTVYRQRLLANKRSGRMAALMHYKRLPNKGVGIGFDAGSSAPYTLFVDQGTKPHPIAPKDPNGFLVFYWPKVGHVVRLKGVNHPGNRPYTFLQRGLDRALRSWLSGR